ncbi:MAG: ABC transporter ATP-binding protein [Bacteroidales bacterium]|nr:ABC transporter ATP-binding protein [Bacteroidales bacterium]
MAAVEKIIEVKNLDFSWKDQPVLSDISFELIAGSFTVMMGRNGSGKSTLMRIMGGLLPYDKGWLKVNGKELNHLKARERARYIGFMAQKHQGVFPFSVQEVVLTGRAAHVVYKPSVSDQGIALEALHLTGIAHLKDRIYTELSGGEQQLVMIARVLAQEPGIILLDEPISHLDYNNQIRILKLCKQLVKRGLTVLAVIHDPNMAFSFGDQFLFVLNRKVHSLTLDEATENGILNEIFENNLNQVSIDGRPFFINRIADKV